MVRTPYVGWQQLIGDGPMSWQAGERWGPTLQATSIRVGFGSWTAQIGRAVGMSTAKTGTPDKDWRGGIDHMQGQLSGAVD
jgi:hypothetical protein